jgi:hypothetical protein
MTESIKYELTDQTALKHTNMKCTTVLFYANIAKLQCERMKITAQQQRKFFCLSFSFF